MSVVTPDVTLMGAVRPSSERVLLRWLRASRTA